MPVAAIMKKMTIMNSFLQRMQKSSQDIVKGHSEMMANGRWREVLLRWLISKQFQLPCQSQQQRAECNDKPFIDHCACLIMSWIILSRQTKWLMLSKNLSRTHNLGLKFFKLLWTVEPDNKGSALMIVFTATIRPRFRKFYDPLHDCEMCVYHIDAQRSCSALKYIASGKWTAH